MIKHLFFDLDNTLWDYRKNAYITLKYMYLEQNINEKYNIDFDIFYKIYYDKNESLWADYRDNIITKEDIRLRRFLESFSIVGIKDIEVSLWFENNYLDKIIKNNNLVNNTEKVLNILSKKYQIHIVSNGFREDCERKVDESNLTNYIETIISAEDCNYRKPTKEIFDFALKITKATKNNSIFIGDDWVADILGASNYGMKTIFLNTLKENYKNKDVIIIDDLKELFNYL